SYMSEESCIQKSRVGGRPGPRPPFFTFLGRASVSRPPHTPQKNKQFKKNKKIKNKKQQKKKKKKNLTKKKKK
ncbi:hypothetical protein, partial [Enterobacter hormaechei]